MAQKLGDLLVSRGLISPEQLSQGLQAQAQLGGRLGTNLVEMGFVTEKQLAMALSAQMEIPYVEADQVANVPNEVIKQLPTELARKYRAVPFALKNRELHLCMADPRNLAAVDELSFRLALSLKVAVISELALNYALERYYGVPRETRFLKLSQGSPSAAAFVQLADDSMSIHGDAIRMDRADFLSDATIPDSRQPARDEQTHVELTDALANIKNEEHLLQCICHFMATIFPRSAIFSLREGQLVGLATVDTEGKPRKIENLGVAIVEDSLVGEVLKGVRVVFREQPDDQMIQKLCAPLLIEPRALSLIPILENRRVVMIALGQGVDRETLKSIFPELLRFLGQVSCAFQILTLRREIMAPRDADSSANNPTQGNL